MAEQRPLAAPKWLLLAFVLTGGLAALAITSIETKTYKATVLMRVRGADSQRLARTYADQVVDRGFLAQIAPRVRPIGGKRLSADQLHDAVDAEQVDAGQLVLLKARAKSRHGAEALASDVANALLVAVKQDVAQHEASLQDELRARLSALDGEIAALRRKGGKAAAQRLSTLTAQRDKLIVQENRALVGAAQQSVGVAVVAPAVAASDPVAPKPVRAFVEGLLAGLVVGLAALWASARRAVRRGAEARQREPFPVRVPQFELPPHADEVVAPAPAPVIAPPVLATLPPADPVPPAEEPAPPLTEPLPPAPEPPKPLPPEPEPEPLPEPIPPAPEPVAASPRIALKLSELERLLAEKPASEPYVQEEREALVFYLRDYASVDGDIPTRFHSVVWESFADLLEAG